VSERRLRGGVLVVAAASIGGTAVELAMERHWSTRVQLIPWMALAIATGGLALATLRPSARAVRVVRCVAAAMVLAAAVGLFVHVRENYTAGPLDFRFADRWEVMSMRSRLWAAATRSVGPAPVLAPAILAQIGVLLALATVGTRHEARS